MPSTVATSEIHVTRIHSNKYLVTGRIVYRINQLPSIVCLLLQETSFLHIFVYCISILRHLTELQDRSSAALLLGSGSAPSSVGAARLVVLDCYPFLTNDLWKPGNISWISDGRCFVLGWSLLVKVSQNRTSRKEGHAFFCFFTWFVSPEKIHNFF